MSSDNGNVDTGGGTVGISPALLQAIAQTLSSATTVSRVSPISTAVTPLQLSATKTDLDGHSSISSAADSSLPAAAAGTKQVISVKVSSLRLALNYGAFNLITYIVLFLLSISVSSVMSWFER